MKKFLASFLLIFMLVPFAFVASACDFGKEEEYDKEANVATFQTAMESLADIGDNYTLVTEVKASDELADLVGYDISEIANMQLKRDGDDFHYLAHNLEYYNVDGVKYDRYESQLTNIWSKFEISNVNNAQAIRAFTDFALLEDQNFELLLNLAYKTNPEAVKTTVTENGTTVSITVDIDAVLNKLIKLLRDNKDKSIAELLDAFFVEFGYEDTTVSGLIQEAKTIITPTTTVSQVADYLKTRTGIDFVQIMLTDAYRGAYRSSSMLDYDLPHNIYATEFESASSYSLAETWNMVKNQNVLALMGEGFTEAQMDAYLDSVYINLASPTFTINNIVDSLLAESDYSTQEVFEYLDILTVDTLHINVDIISNSDQVVQIKTGVEAGVSFKTGGIKTSVEFEVEGSVYITDVGTTRVQLPTNIPSDYIEAVIEVESLDTDNGLVLTNVTFPCATDLAIEDYVTYNASSKTLAISEVVIESLREYRESYPYTNALTFSINHNGIRYELIVVEK